MTESFVGFPTFDIIRPISQRLFNRSGRCALIPQQRCNIDNMRSDEVPYTSVGQCNKPDMCGPAYNYVGTRHKSHLCLESMEGGTQPRFTVI